MCTWYMSSAVSPKNVVCSCSCCRFKRTTDIYIYIFEFHHPSREREEERITINNFLTTIFNIYPFTPGPIPYLQFTHTTQKCITISKKNNQLFVNAWEEQSAVIPHLG